MFNPLHKHVKVLVDAAGPVIEERRRQETEAYENGVKWERSLDVMQRMLDNSEKYGFVDLEDICGHLMVLVLASIHTTTDTSTSLMYYLACFPQYHEPLFQECQKVLGQIEAEREELRQKKLQSGEFESAEEFVGSELDPARDRDLSAAALKRMVHMDSFVREIFRYRHTRMEIMHLARKPVTLSNGMKIAKGQMVAINLRSVHRSHEYQGEDPAEFRPWRFLGKAKAATKVAKDYLPFGMGPYVDTFLFCSVRLVLVFKLRFDGIITNRMVNPFGLLL
jgi:cytochrome P450